MSLQHTHYLPFLSSNPTCTVSPLSPQNSNRLYGHPQMRDVRHCSSTSVNSQPFGKFEVLLILLPKKMKRGAISVSTGHSLQETSRTEIPRIIQISSQNLTYEGESFSLNICEYDEQVY